MSQDVVEPADPRAEGFRAAAFRIVALALGIALIIAISGSARDPQDIAAWLVEALLGSLIGLAVGRWVAPAAWYQRRIWAVALLIAVCITVPLTGVVLARIAFLQGRPITPAVLIDVLPSVFGTTLVMTALAMFVRPRGPTQTHAAPQGAPPPKFLARLPAKLRGADLYAIEAEDHYLRLHTSLGQDLILMRLSDAIVELEGLEGAQTHRSWWVAKGAVADVERLDGRAVLTLKDGAEAPVSRGFARGLRAAGWF